MVIAHLDAFRDRVRAEAPRELGGARRHARAGARSQTEAAIVDQGGRLALKQMKGCDQACKYNRNIIRKENADGVAVGYVED